MAGEKTVTVLLIEDDPADVELLREGLGASRLAVDLYTVDDGSKALRYLRRQPPYAEAIRPDLILLDLNLPRKNGGETLREIKADPHLHRIPVVVLTTSAAATDIQLSQNLGASSFISKPASFAELVTMVAALENFWAEKIHDS